MFGKAISEKRKTGTIPVYLNIYDITSFNGCSYWFGFGVYHSGVEVHEVEYSFGEVGLQRSEPKECSEIIPLRKSILIGKTDLGPREVEVLMVKLGKEYKGHTYNLTAKNCNHFSNDACIKLTGKPIPKWVNRLAKIGLYCICGLPVVLNFKCSEASASQSGIKDSGR